jgi:trans-aconitate methyltransferase
VSGVGAGNGDAAALAPQQWSAERYAQHAAFVPAFGVSLLEWLAPRAGERILDLGCGDGTLTRQIAERGAEVVGVDAAPDFVAAAGKAGVDARLGDARSLTFDGEFDAVFSNAVLHWVVDADAALDGVFRALRRGGRFVAEFGGHGCIAAIVVALTAALQRRGRLLQSPWYFPTAEEYAAKLTAHGFEIDSIELYPRLTPLPTGIRGWLETFAGSMIDVLPDAERASLVDDVETLLRPMLCDTAGRWTADYVRLRLIARRPGSAKASAERSATAARRTPD